MNIRQLHIMLLSLLCAALAACSDQAALVDVPSEGGKTPIELNIGGVDAQQPLTRAVISSDQGKTMQAFPKGSSIYMLMMAKEIDGDGFKTTRTVGFAQDQDPETTLSDVSFTASSEGAKFIRYWDDAYARKTALSIAAVSTPGYGPTEAGATTVDNKTWAIGGENSFQSIPWTVPGGSGDIETSTYVDWPVGNHSNKDDQSVANFITFQDLCFSNNIGNNAKYGLSDTRITFDPATKKFGAGTLIFNHALSKLTFKIKKGEGFTDDEFQFNTDTNIKLSNFYKSGRFIIGTGEFTQTSPNAPVKGDIAKINLRATPEDDDKFTLDALVIPGTDMTSSDNAVTFYLNHNEYKLTMAQLYAAFSDDQKTNFFATNKLKAGVHYVFTFTVSKTQISGLTAQVVPWEAVTADNINASNARISLMLEERGDYVDTGVDFYRAKDPDNSSISDNYKGYSWKTGYNTDGKATETSCISHKWATPHWYWPDNTTFYHFRALAPTSQVVTTATNDYTTLTAGETYTDVRWGAPFLDDADDETAGSFKFYYNTTKGFDATGDGSPNASHQIYHGIGPTNADIKLLMFHMMSDVTIKVKSVTGDAAVQLGNGSVGNCTTIKFEKIYKSGTVNLGNGLVTGVFEQDESAKGDFAFTAHPSPDGSGFITWANYGAIPQDLAGTTVTDDVVLVITTPDKNEYRVSMKDVKATTVDPTNLANPYTTVGGTGADKDKYIIDRWYPGFKYTYTFFLSKKKIESITATILDWETVTADDEPVQIK